MRFCTLLVVVVLALTFSAALGFWDAHSLTSQVKTKGKNEEQKTKRINILGYEDEDYDEDDVYFDHGLRHRYHHHHFHFGYPSQSLRKRLSTDRDPTRVSLVAHSHPKRNLNMFLHNNL